GVAGRCGREVPLLLSHGPAPRREQELVSRNDGRPPADDARTRHDWTALRGRRAPDYHRVDRIRRLGVGRGSVCGRSAGIQEADLRDAVRLRERHVRALRQLLCRAADTGCGTGAHPVRTLGKAIHIIGGGLAGCEAAWQVARRGLNCVLHEMRPERPTPAHQTGRLAELVCSNSLKSELESTAPWLLKEESRRLGSLLLQAAQDSRVPGGHALTVDREGFATEVTRAIASEPLIELPREEITALL